MCLFSYMKIFSTLFLFIILSSSVNAGVYKWTDEEGNVHYGDKPINQDDTTELKINTDTDTGITNSSGNDKERTRMAQELQEDREAREKKRADRRVEKKKQQKTCAKLKKRLIQHQRASGVYKRDANGERVYYTPKERDSQVEKINKGIRKNCR